MRKILYVALMAVLMLPACKARYSFNTREGKQKLKYYNNVPYRGYPTNPKSKK